MRRLELTIVRRLEGYLHGDHLGLLPGPGSDDQRRPDLSPGEDDVRKIDWAVTARTTVPYVRDTISDRELEVWALLDVTPSMNWGTEGVTKRDLGIAAIATIGFLSQKMGDRFGGYIMRPDKLRRLPARSGRSALYGLLRKMLTEPFVPDHAIGPMTLAAAVEQLSRTQRRRGLRVVVSDFLTPGDHELDPNVEPEWERSMRRLGVRNQVLAIEVVDRREIEFPNVGDMLIRDPGDRLRALRQHRRRECARPDGRGQRRPAGTNPDLPSSCRCRAHPAAYRPRLGARHRPVRAGLPPRGEHAARTAPGSDEVSSPLLVRS